MKKSNGIFVLLTVLIVSILAIKYLWWLLLLIIVFAAYIYFKGNKKQTNNETNAKNQNYRNHISRESPVEHCPITYEPRGVIKAFRNDIFNMDNITFLKNKFIAIDIETTGLKDWCDEIIEISAVTFCDGYPVNEYVSFIKPTFDIPASVTNINNITNEMVSNAPNIKEVMLEFYSLIKDDIENNVPLVAHNASFDIRFISRALEKCGITAEINYQDTLYLSRRLIKDSDNHKLCTLSDYFQITNNNLHRAGDDAKACGFIFYKLLDIMERDIKNRLSVFSDAEIKIINMVKLSLLDNKKDVTYLAFEKTGSFLKANYFYQFLKIKTKCKKPYIICKKLGDETESLLCAVDCPKSEGDGQIRIFVDYDTNDYKTIAPIIVREYNRIYEITTEYITNNETATRNVRKFINESITI